MIPRIDLAALVRKDADAVAAMRVAATDVGFATVYNTGLDADRVGQVIETYRAFFALSVDKKAPFDMAQTGSNRGWGAPASEQVDPTANPDFKEVFDCGVTLRPDDPLLENAFYAPNRWPDEPADFAAIIGGYYAVACDIGMQVLRGVALSIGAPEHAFDAGFDKPMALLRGNFYPSRPATAGDKDFGIAPHTDYGCLTLLATDGSPGLEVRKRGGGWTPLSTPPGEFAINFGEMMELWSGRKVIATPHRVIGGAHERISAPLFFNPSHDTNVGPMGTDKVVLAGDHLSRRYRETYVHLQDKAG